MDAPTDRIQPQRVVRSGHETKHQPARLFLACLGMLGLVAIYQFWSPAIRVGDGMEYYGLFFAWTETYRPWMSEASFKAYELFHQSGVVAGTLGRDFLQSSFPTLRLGDTADFNHFWLYSLLAAVVHWTFRLVGISLGPQASFDLLHLLLFGLLLVLASRLHGWKGFFAVSLLIVGSPVLWYANKVHTEFLTVVMTIGTVALVARNHLSFAALFMATAATQNPGLSVVAVVLLGMRAILDWNRSYSRWEVAAIGASLLLLAAHPAYYWFRFQTITPQLLAGGASLGAGFRSSLIWLFDPDVGLFPNWPLGLLLVVIGTWAIVKYRTIRAEFPYPGRLALAGFVFVAISLFSHSSTTNLNSGATPGLARYALWYIAAVYPFAIASIALIALLARRSRTLGVGLLGVAVAASIAFVVRTPYESYSTPSTVSRFVQHYLPWAYDPPAEIFTERYSGYAEAPASLTAVVGPDCKKTLVYPGAPTDGIVVVPAGCEFGAGQLRRWANAQSAAISNPTYERLSADDVAEPLPIALGRSYPFDTREDGVALSGWSMPEATHIWSEGSQSRITLDLPPPNGKPRCLVIDGFSLGPQTIALAVDGAADVEAKLNGEGRISVPLGDALGRTAVLLSFSNPRVPGNGDMRVLAFALRTLTVDGCER